jgi:hypothetical protein
MRVKRRKRAPGECGTLFSRLEGHAALERVWARSIRLIPFATPGADRCRDEGKRPMRGCHGCPPPTRKVGLRRTQARVPTTTCARLPRRGRDRDASGNRTEGGRPPPRRGAQSNTGRVGEPSDDPGRGRHDRTARWSATRLFVSAWVVYERATYRGCFEYAFPLRPPVDMARGTRSRGRWALSRRVAPCSFGGLGRRRCRGRR